MRGKNRLLYGLFILSLLISMLACRFGTQPITATEAAPTPGVVASEEAEGPSKTQASEGTPTEEPEFPIETIRMEDVSNVQAIRPSPEVVGVGENLQLLSQPWVNGTLKISGPDETLLNIQMVQGRAEVDLPVGTPKGIYSVILENQEARLMGVGSFRVASEPGIWIRTNRSYATFEQTLQVWVSAWGVPKDLPAAIQVSNPSFLTATNFGPGQQEGMLEPFPIGQPPLLKDLLGKAWTLPPGVIGEIDVIAGEDLVVVEITEDLFDDSGELIDEPPDDYTELPDLKSNQVKVVACDEPSFIEGDLGETGEVRALWSEAGIQSTATSTPDGPFRLQAGPGLVLLNTFRYEQSRQSSVAVRLTCGETIVVGAAESTLTESIKTAYPMLGVNPDDLGDFRLQSTGDAPFDEEGWAECRLLDDGGLKISFHNDIESAMFFSLEIPGFDGSGTYPGVFELMDFWNGEANGPAEVEVVADRIDDQMGVKGSFIASYNGEPGSGDVQGDFSCTYLLPLLSSNEINQDQSVSHPGGKKILALEHYAPSFQAASPPDNTCRSAVIMHDPNNIEAPVASKLTMALWQARLRLDILTSSDILALLNLHQERQLLGDDEDSVQSDIQAVAGALNADFLFLVQMAEGNPNHLTISAIRMRDTVVIGRSFRSHADIEEVVFSDIYQEIAEKMPQADICGEIEPVEKHLNHGEETDIVFKITDLAGEKVSLGDVKVNITQCGELQPTSGPIQDGEFKTTYEANEDIKPCNDVLEFTASADMGGGKVETRPKEGRTTMYIADGWQVGMSIDMSQGEDSISLAWEGNFYVNAEGIVSGIGTGSIWGDMPNYPCLVLDFDHGEVREEENPTTMNGSFSFYVKGEANDEGENTILKMTPLGYGTNMVYNFGNQTCARGLTYDPLTGSIISLVAENPLLFASASQVEIEAKNGASTSVILGQLEGQVLEVTIQRVIPSGSSE